MLIIDKSSIKFTDYLYVFLLYMISGSHAFGWEGRFIVISVLSLLLYRQKILDKSVEYKRCMTFLGVALFVFICQYFVFKWNSSPAIVNFSAKVFCAYAVVKILGVRFRSAAFIVMYWLCAVSIIMFSIYATIHYAPDIFNIPNYASIGIWNTSIGSYSESIRNHGPFWEPGAFAGYIIMTLLLFLDDFPQLYKENKRKVICILVALVTTFSTTGYLVAFIFAFYVLLATKARKYAFFFVPIAIALSIYAFSQDFMGEKLQEQLESSQDVNIHGNRVNHGRFSAMIFDLYYIEKHPLVGNGFHQRTRYADHQYMGEYLVGFGNGLTGFTGCMGIPYILLFFYYIKKNLSTDKGNYVILLMLALLLYGEYYINYPLIYIFLFTKVSQVNIHSSCD